MKKAILLTSLGAKYSLLQRVKQARDKFNKNLRIIGADSSEKALTKNFVTEFWHMPRLQDLGITDLLSFCQAQNIRYIIPTRDGEVPFFAQHKTLLKEHGVYVFVCSYENVMLCYDKYTFYQKAPKDYSIATALDPNELNAERFVIKERFGGGSKNIALNVPKEDLQKLRANFTEPIFQNFIEGDEYSVDSYVDKEGVLRASIVRSRDLIKSGEAKKTTSVSKPHIVQKVQKFLESFAITGHSVTQMFEDKEGILHLIECNTRYGGASSLSYELGLESFYWFLLECAGRDFTVELQERQLTQIRVEGDHYFES